MTKLRTLGQLKHRSVARPSPVSVIPQVNTDIMQLANLR